MKVIVFGGSGFLGSHIADYLTGIGHSVTIFDKYKSKYINDKQLMVIGDIQNMNEVNEVVKNSDIVYNFAASADIENSDCINIIKNNIIGNTNILKSCIKHNIKRFIFASTIYIYGNKGSFYRISKQACESIIEEYNRLYGLPYTILRYGSLYGPRANEYNSIFNILSQAIDDGKIIRHGDGEEIREYIYVKDAAKLSVDILDEKYENKNIVITGNQTIKIKDLNYMIKEILGDDIEIEYLESSGNSHYIITPYSFNHKPAQKLESNLYHDMGQGLLECIQEIYGKRNTK